MCARRSPLNLPHVLGRRTSHSDQRPRPCPSYRPEFLLPDDLRAKPFHIRAGTNLGPTEYLCDGSSFSSRSLKLPSRVKSLKPRKQFLFLGMRLLLDRAAVQEILSREDLPEPGGIVASLWTGRWAALLRSARGSSCRNIYEVIQVSTGVGNRSSKQKIDGS